MKQKQSKNISKVKESIKKAAAKSAAEGMTAAISEFYENEIKALILAYIKENNIPAGEKVVLTKEQTAAHVKTVTKMLSEPGRMAALKIRALELSIGDTEVKKLKNQVKVIQH